MFQPWVALRALALGLSVGASPATVPEPAPGVTRAENGSVEMQYRTYRKWKILLPNETFAPVGDGFTAGGEKFIAQLEGTALAVDTDGDGKTDVRADGESALVTLRGKTGGAPFTYAVRLDSKRGWRFAAAGAMVGKVGDTKIQLIDQNNNGRYNDYGEDAMIVGRGRAASFLSKTIRLDGALHSITVAADGSKVEYAPFEGDAGRLDLRSKLDTRAKLASVVVRSADGSHSFELSRADGAVEVPAGRYQLHSGRLGLGQTTVTMQTGRAKPFEVEANGSTAVAWGGPIRVEFDYNRSGNSVQFSPDAVWYYGQSGEEYVNWSPPGKSPEFVIKDKNEDRELVIARFGGC
ncbi:MAG: hypothetical protein AAF488_19085 [Planctomycetota bacterium]